MYVQQGYGQKVSPENLTVCNVQNQCLVVSLSACFSKVTKLSMRILQIQDPRDNLVRICIKFIPIKYVYFCLSYSVYV